MVVKMMKWRPWPPPISRKYEVKLIVRRLEGFDRGESGTGGFRRLAVEIRWKGPKLSLRSLRRTAVKRNFTKEVDVEAMEDQKVRNGVVEWDEEFQSLCNLSTYKDNVFHPWEIAFTVFNYSKQGLNQGPKNKVPVIGTVSLNLAEYASLADKKEFELNIPLTLLGGATESRSPSLIISLSLLELRAAQQSAEPVQRAIVPVSSPTQLGETASVEKDELSAIKAGLRKVKIFTGYVSARRAKKAVHVEEGSEGRCSARSDDGEYNYPLDSDSLDDFEEADSDEGREESSIRKSFSYGKLAYANYAGGSFYSSMRIHGDDEDWVYYSNQRSDARCSQVDESAALASEPSLSQSSKRSILPWKKRKLSFRSPKAKGEPLLKKAYGEEGGDDIDFDRRQLSSSDESLSLGMQKAEEDSSANRTSVSEFGDDNFAIGSWEQKEVTSRDGHMKLETQVFFASIDQRNERAAGESACTALVAVMADWFQNNHGLMPIKSQFESLIREGSLEWRKLCENETFKERFPDKHFDLETVIQAKVRPLSVVPGKSFIGFFHPEGMDEGKFDFLHGAMSFDNIWDEISRDCPSNVEPHVYIVSWNDHFFVLKIDQDACYIIDTLGERLYEGCHQAYILKFDRSTLIRKLPDAAQSSDEKTATDLQTVGAIVDSNDKQPQQVNPNDGSSVAGLEGLPKCEQGDEIVCQGKESCKEYIKSFLAAIPIRELQADIKRGSMLSTPLHQRLQIEFHYTQLLEPLSVTPATEVIGTTTAQNLGI